MEEIKIKQTLFVNRVRKGRKELSNLLNWLCYLASNLKRARLISIFYILLNSFHQLDQQGLLST